MALSILLKEFEKHPHFEKVTGKLAGDEKRFLLKGLAGSSKTIFTASVIHKNPGIYLFILSEKDEAAYFYNDLINLLGDDNILFFPSSYKRSVQFGQPDNGNMILRTNVLNRVGDIKKNNDDSNYQCIVTYPEALVEKVVTHQKLQKNTLQLIKGENVPIEFISEVLDEYKFERVDFVYEPGQYSVRGGIVDIFSFAYNYPFRVDFFGDQVDTIRSFDVDTQLSERQFDKIAILPNVQLTTVEDVRESFLDFIPASAIVFSSDIAYIADKMNDLFENALSTPEEDATDKSKNLTTGSYLLKKIFDFKTVEISGRSFFTNPSVFQFNTSLQPSFNKNFQLLGDTLLQNQTNSLTNYLLTDSEKQVERLSAIFADITQNVKFQPVLKTLHEGFIEKDLKLCCFTDHQIFERYHKYQVNAYFSSKASLSLKELKGLQPGDYVVHIDHGIGRFGGLEKITRNGKQQESVRLVYKDNDILYVSIHSLHRISKYKGKDEGPPKIYKLGSGAWQKLKQTTKKKIKDIARELITLYAKRKKTEGFQFSKDTYLQNELEASFIFEDTPDQESATIAVKKDMESLNPMDRLICGDVGFGKTEVAVRAAFKAVADSKQVAILVPTTILALQHYNTIRERLNGFPCNVDYISRLKKQKDQKITLDKLKDGKVDILIGTHRLLGKDLKFKNLGLLIIDEEQKFGVSAKEKLRLLMENVDTLTLTATPIPRTLQFSLMGSRDLSVINTPPPNRHPIVTELHTFNEEIIREGINYEVSRGGQVFFVHNRVNNLIDIERMIQKLCPKVRIIAAHGQMDGEKLEQIMLDFIRGDFDVLVATTIIESGLDIPNVNTIFINHAHHFGLSDLHQLRGRVGRSNRKAFCYLLAPPLNLLTPEARRRLKAIEEYSDLGSGFNIALQDLDIRGAGNLLGAEQSGFISDIGFDAYNRILNEAIEELKESEFRDVYAEERSKNPEKEKYIDDCQVDTDLELLFPDEYISNISERLNLYRELDNLQNERELKQFEEKIHDRFGPLPPQTAELLEVVKLRWIAVKMGFEKIVLKNGILIGYFISNQSSDFYKSHIFSKILSFVQKKPKLFKMKEGNEKLTLTIDHIKSIHDAFKIFESIMVEEVNA